MMFQVRLAGTDNFVGTRNTTAGFLCDQDRRRGKDPSTCEAQLVPQARGKVWTQLVPLLKCLRAAARQDDLTPKANRIYFETVSWNAYEAVTSEGRVEPLDTFITRRKMEELVELLNANSPLWVCESPWEWWYETELAKTEFIRGAPFGDPGEYCRMSFDIFPNGDVVSYQSQRADKVGGLDLTRTPRQLFGDITRLVNWLLRD
jgi:hypothetical protein